MATTTTKRGVRASVDWRENLSVDAAVSNASRLVKTAQKAQELGITYFATTLASSRWKSLEQIERAGHKAEQMAEGIVFWAQNWRKGGLQERRNQLLKEYDFYNQQYCGCEFSMRNT